MTDIIYRCKACGADIKLEAKFCHSCGAENVIRLEKIAELESKSRKAERWTGELKEDKKRAIGAEIAKELSAGALARKARRLKTERAKLVTGGTHEGKLQWIKEQLDLKRTVSEIAEELGESMIRVAKYVDEIEKLNSN